MEYCEIELKSHFPRRDSDTYVYLKRGQTGVVRTIRNEDEIIDTLVKRGFQVVDITSDSLDSIIQTLLNAKIVVSLEGSHLAHWIYTAPDNGGLLVLQPRRSIYRAAASLCRMFGYQICVRSRRDCKRRISFPSRGYSPHSRSVVGEHKWVKRIVVTVYGSSEFFHPTGATGDKSTF